MKSKQAPGTIVLLLALLCTPPVYAQLQCGDVNLDGMVTVGDAIFLADYLSQNGPAPESLWVADVDGIAGLTISDLQVMLYLPLILDLELTCDVTQTGFAAKPAETTYVARTFAPAVPEPDMFWRVELWQTISGPGGGVANGLTGFCFSFSYACSTSAISLETIVSHVDAAIVSTVIDSVNQKGMFAFSGIPLTDTACGGRILLAEFEFRIDFPSVSDPTHIIIDTTNFGPSNTFVAVENYTEPGIPILYGTPGTPAEPPSCCEGMTGDVNDDNNTNLTDLSVLVNSLFVTYDPLPCPAEGNINGDAECLVSLTDLTLLVNHLFVCFGCVPADCTTFDNFICQ